VEAEGLCGSTCFHVNDEAEGRSCSWTPEYLFLAAAISSYACTFRELALHDGLRYSTLEIEAEGRLQLTGSGMRFTEIVLRPNLALTRERDRERALELLGAAVQRSVISQSIRATVQLQHVVTVSVAAA
jgi:organic hydroperoxide reductase OsmC/OhrA